MDVILSRRARFDLIDIQDYIGNDNPAAAMRVIDDMFAAFDTLAANPGIGHIRQDLTTRDVRFWTVHSYMIVYEVSPARVNIARVLSGYRDIAALLD